MPRRRAPESPSKQVSRGGRGEGAGPFPGAPPAVPPACELCGRATPTLTEHHLVPRSQGRRRGVKVAELPTARLCSPCHKFLHRTFSNAELAAEYASLERLRAHPDVARFVAWLRKQPPTRGIRVR